LDPAAASTASTAVRSLLSAVQALESSKKRVALAVGLALLVHVPLTPVLPMARLLHRISGRAERPEPTPPPEPIEVEMRHALRDEEKRQEERERPEPAANNAAELAPPANVKFAAAAPDKPADAAGEKPKDPKKDKVKAIGLEGKAKKLLGKPGITLGLWFTGLREHPLGKELAELASCNREWRQFVDQGVDLLSDFDGVLVVGPDLYDPSQMTAAVRHGLPEARVHDVMDALVKQSGDRGRWLKADVASARVGKVQRVLLPQQKDLFFVAPSKGWEALHAVKEPLGVPSAQGRTASLVLVNPNRALKRIGLTLPKQIEELRVEAFVNSDQSVDVKVELEAATNEGAERDAKRVAAELHEFFADTWTLTSTLSALAGAGSDRADAPPALDLEVDGRTLSGTVHLSPNQTKATLALLSSVMCKKRGAVRGAPAAAP
jgi:hypothetical protein